jgi:hypothetical protein
LAGAGRRQLSSGKIYRYEIRTDPGKTAQKSKSGEITKGSDLFERSDPFLFVYVSEIQWDKFLKQITNFFSAVKGPNNIVPQSQKLYAFGEAKNDLHSGGRRYNFLSRILLNCFTGLDRQSEHENS